MAERPMRNGVWSRFACFAALATLGFLLGFWLQGMRGGDAPVSDTPPEPLDMRLSLGEPGPAFPAQRPTVVCTTTTEIIELPRDWRTPLTSPGGRYVIALETVESDRSRREATRVRLSRAADGAPVATLPRLVPGARIVWSPADDAVALFAACHPCLHGGHSELFVWREGEGFRVLRTPLPLYRESLLDITWSPDSRRLLMQVGGTQGSTIVWLGELWLLDPWTGEYALVSGGVAAGTEWLAERRFRFPELTGERVDCPAGGEHPHEEARWREGAVR